MSSPPPNPSFSFQNIGLGYTIAITLTFLILLSSLLLTSYLCYRSRRRNLRSNTHINSSPTQNSNSSIIVPRVFFVAEDDNNETSGVVGLDRAIINSYPKFQFFKNNNVGDIESNNNNNNENENVCSICLCDYKEGEMLRMMPDCKHYFHLCCLDAWLKLNGSCPVCRNSPLPTPVSTPLAEVMPLSLYPDNRRRSAVVSSTS